jgi:CubicO group peptidase (beta-lactamase class C family)
MRGRLPGLSIAVVKPDGVRWMQGFGLADIATRAPATPRMVCSWFSMTKIATATAVMQLWERGRLDLDHPVTRYYPGFGSLRPASSAEAVTIRHLLSHSSGLANPIPVRWVHLAGQPTPDPQTFLSHVLAKHAKLQFAPGAKASYTNLGYLVLGEVIASASGRSYQDYLRENVLEPLGMHRTGFAHTAEMSAFAATAYHKRWSPMAPLLRWMLPAAFFGARADGFITFNRFYLDGAAYGGLIGPVEDAARFLRAHLRGGELDGRRILSPASTQLMQQISAYGGEVDVGMGWFRPRSARQAQRQFVEHLGGGAGFFNCMRLYPDAALGVVMMGNATSYDHDSIARAVADRWWHEPEERTQA